MVSKWLIVVGTEGIGKILGRFSNEVEVTYVICPKGQRSVVEDRAKRIYAWETDWNRVNFWREVEVIARRGGEIYYLIVYADTYSKYESDIELKWDKNRIYYVEDDKGKHVVAVVLVDNVVYATYWIRHAFDFMKWIDWLMITLGAEVEKVVPMEKGNEEEIKEVSEILRQVEKGEEETILADEAIKELSEEEKEKLLKRIERSLRVRKIKYDSIVYGDGKVMVFTNEEVSDKVRKAMEKKFGVKIEFVKEGEE